MNIEEAVQTLIAASGKDAHDTFARMADFMLKNPDNEDAGELYTSMRRHTAMLAAAREFAAQIWDEAYDAGCVDTEMYLNPPDYFGAPEPSTTENPYAKDAE